MVVVSLYMWLPMTSPLAFPPAQRPLTELYGQTVENMAWPNVFFDVLRNLVLR